MSIIQGNAHTSAGGGYQIERSLRFNSADSAYLNRTPASASNRKTWTWSGWVKKSALGSLGYLFSVPDSTGHASLRFTTSDTLEWAAFTAANGAATTNAVFRDASAWYHIVFAMDTTQATTTNRIKLYVNNVLQTFSSYTAPTQNQDTPVNNTVEHDIGKRVNVSEYLSSYLTEINFIDGQALTPSSFGETDSATSVWKPKAYSGTYGTNGFYLKFADNSGTTSTTLGKDSSGNGNNWTPNNFSVTAGSGNDSLVDTPTSYGTDTGVGGEVRGNYCTPNPLDTNSALLFANGNLDLSNSSGVGVSCRSTFQMASGKWYWEFTVGTAGTYVGGGIGTSAATTGSYTGDSGTSYGYLSHTGNKYNSGAASAYGATFTNGDVIGISFDSDAGTLIFYKNGSSQGTAFSSLTGGTYFPMFSARSGSISVNFGQRAFAYTAPSGFKALCTQNLPTPTIGATSTTQANDYFNAVTYTGNGTSLSVTGVGFQPDLIWIKDRSNARAHVLQNAIAGFSQYLQSNATDAETTSSSGVTAVGSDGFTVGTQLAWNSNTETYVAWNWNAGGSTVTNTSGTISAQVRANTTSGFSIVTYTGNGTANATIGHGLGVTPAFIITKSRSDATTQWVAWHKDLSGAFSTTCAYIYLNSTQLASTTTIFYNGTLIDSSKIGLQGTNTTINNTGSTYVAYCFAPVAGYSAFGSYTGNGSADGPFIYTGFRPRFVIRKCSSATSNWFINDAARNPSNVVLLRLNADLSDAESSGANSDIDFLSNGFKIRATSTAGVNQSGQTHIYMAFAENPFKYSLAR